MAAPKRYKKKELEKFRKLLLEKKSQLIAGLSDLERNAIYSSSSGASSEISGLANHMADAATDINAIETNFNLAERESRYLLYIEEALKRVNQGTYGICKGCNKIIPKERLEVVPTATRCISCKQNTKVLEYRESTMSRKNTREDAEQNE